MGGVLFEQCLATLHVFHLENWVNEKIIMMVILEGTRKCISPVTITDYVEQLVVLFNNGAMHVMGGECQ